MNSAITFINEKFVKFEKKKKIEEIKRLRKTQLSNEKTWGNGCSTRQTRAIF